MKHLYNLINDILDNSDLDNLYLFLKIGKDILEKGVWKIPSTFSWKYDDIENIVQICRQNEQHMDDIFLDKNLIETVKYRIRGNVFSDLEDHAKYGAYIDHKLICISDSVSQIIDYLYSKDKATICNCGAVIYNGKIIDYHTRRQVKTW